MKLLAKTFLSFRDKADSGMADRHPCLGPTELGQAPTWERSETLCAGPAVRLGLRSGLPAVRPGLQSSLPMPGELE